jgi:hypothetical protein
MEEGMEKTNTSASSLWSAMAEEVLMSCSNTKSRKDRIERVSL